MTGDDAALARERDRLLDFYQRAAVDPRGGFLELDDAGRPVAADARSLFSTTRMTYSFALAQMVGRAGAAEVVDHGLRFLRDCHRDGAGGYAEEVRDGAPAPGTRELYGHAFVILAAAAATLAERPHAAELLDDALAVVDARFWRSDRELAVEQCAPDWRAVGDYRGANSHMHLVEAWICAADATGRDVYRERALTVARRLIAGHAADHGWRIPEHYDRAWRPDLDHNAADPQHLTRPYGSNVGHGMEWARLLLQLERRGADDDRWLCDAAVALYDRAAADGWDRRAGGFVYTVGWDGAPSVADRYWWTTAEAIAGAAALWRRTGEERFERWMRRAWEFAERHLIDRERGGWIHQLDAGNRPKSDPWSGKPDLYHALQACLVPLLAVDRSVAAALRDAVDAGTVGRAGTVGA